MPIGTIAAISAGAAILGGISKRRARRKAARRKKKDLSGQKSALKRRRNFEVDRAREAGEEFLGQTDVQNALAGVVGGSGTSTAAGFELSEQNIKADINQLQDNFGTQIKSITSAKNAASKAGRVSFGDALGFIGDVAGGATEIYDAGGFSGLANVSNRRQMRRNRRDPELTQYGQFGALYGEEASR